MRMKAVYVDKSVLFACENKPLKSKFELDVNEETFFLGVVLSVVTFFFFFLFNIYIR